MKKPSTQKRRHVGGVVGQTCSIQRNHMVPLKTARRREGEARVSMSVSVMILEERGGGEV